MWTLIATVCTYWALFALAPLARAEEPGKSIFDEDPWTSTSRPALTQPAATEPASQTAVQPTATTQGLAINPAAIQPPPPSEPAVRFNPPSRERHGETLKLVKETFENEYRATTPAGHQTLGQRLLTEVAAIRKNQDARYVLLREAFEAGVLAVDPELCQRALAALSQSFIADFLAIAEDAVLKVLAKPSTASLLSPGRFRRDFTMEKSIGAKPGALGGKYFAEAGRDSLPRWVLDGGHEANGSCSEIRPMQNSASSYK